MFESATIPLYLAPISPLPLILTSSVGFVNSSIEDPPPAHPLVLGFAVGIYDNARLPPQ